MTACSNIAPRLDVLGVYSPAADHERYEQFIRAEVDRYDPDKNPEIGKLLASFGRTPSYDRAEAEQQLRSSLGTAAVVEILVDSPDLRFRPDDFLQVNPKLPKEQWQAAWDETYLSVDGETLLAGYPNPAMPNLPHYRIVFFIHDWKQGATLLSSYGPLAYPPIAPLPERLWRLVPYETVD